MFFPFRYLFQLQISQKFGLHGWLLLLPWESVMITYILLFSVYTYKASSLPLSHVHKPWFLRARVFTGRSGLNSIGLLQTLDPSVSSRCWLLHKCISICPAIFLYLFPPNHSMPDISNPLFVDHQYVVLSPSLSSNTNTNWLRGQRVFIQLLYFILYYCILRLDIIMVACWLFLICLLHPSHMDKNVC